MEVSKGKRFDEGVVQAFAQLTLPQILTKQAERLGTSQIAIREKMFGIWLAYTWEDYHRYTKQVALGLVALGLKRGENIGLIVNNHPEWLYSELGAQSLGTITVNMFTSSIAKELTTMLNRIQAAVAIVQDQEQVDKLLEMKDQLAHVRKVIYIDPTGMRTYADNPWLISFQDLLKLGEDLDKKQPRLYEEEMWKGKPEEVALMIMTSGTTGIPKLAMISHQSFTEIARKWIETAPIGVGDNWISITPTAWIVDQMWGMGVSPLTGMAMNFPETLETQAEDFREIGPVVIITSSRFWEDLASKIRVKMADSGWIKRKLFSLGEKVGGAVVDRESKKEPVPVSLAFLHRFFSRIVYKPLLDRVGCAQIRAAVTGGHPISPDVIRFFRAKGLNLKHAYGLTEGGGVFQVQPDKEVKPESVGKPLPRTEVKIAEDQEVLVKTPSCFVGYYQDSEATQKALREGWLYTGDAGYIDDDGHLLIIGRKEEIMRTKAGEAISSDFIETRLKFSPYIKEAVVWGEGRDYITGFINIDFGNVGSWAEDRMIPYTTFTDLSQQPAVEELILGEVRQVNTQLPKPMRLHKIILLYKLLDADDEELTRTGKVRRKFVYEQYINLIEAMYSGQKDLAVTGKVRYRDGHVGTIETKVKILDVE
ncbi:MAG: long-chain fatty acid--CoA ligase [Deltaproteobacteria bacterium]|nr:long-chain fatty acid--CoA ligase [Deltaproteobacteria bacterium]